MTNEYNITLDPSADVLTSNTLGHYTSNSSFEILRRLNCTATGVGSTREESGNKLFTLNQGDSLTLNLDYTSLDTSGEKRINAIYLNNLILALYKDPTNNEVAGLHSVGQLATSELQDVLDGVDGFGNALTKGGTALFKMYGSQQNGQTLGANLWSYSNDSNGPASHALATLTVNTTDSYDVELHLMGNLILETVDNGAGPYYYFLSFAHDPRMSINPD